MKRELKNDLRDKIIVIVSLVVVIALIIICSMAIHDKQNESLDRFKEAYSHSDGVLLDYIVYVDMETGVLYLYKNGSMTVMYGADGKPLTCKLEE